MQQGKGHPIVQELRNLLKQEGIPIATACEKAGYDRGIVYQWQRNGTAPNVAALNDILNVIGYKISIVRNECQK